MGSVRRSVYQVSPRSVAVTLGGLGLVLLPAVFAEQLIRTHRSGHGAGVNWFDKFAIGQDSAHALWLGNLGTIAGIATPFVVDWFDTSGKRRVFFEDAVVVCQALVLNGALNTAVKYITQRPLPETYAGVVPNRRDKPRGYRAFYSGHVSSLATSLAAGCMTMRLRHGRFRWRWPWIVSSTLTVLVSVGRIFSGKHFPSDVLVAAPIGAAIGAAVPLLHRRKGRLRRRWAMLRRKRRWRSSLRSVL